MVIIVIIAAGEIIARIPCTNLVVIILRFGKRVSPRGVRWDESFAIELRRKFAPASVRFPLRRIENCVL